MNILLTGATGYIGRRLKERLLEDEKVRLRLFVRNAKKVRDKYRDRVEIFEGNTLDRESLKDALKSMDVAYYLVHSMGAKADFEHLDRISAQNFLDACIENQVKRIIYLGGLGKKETASKHLRSRIETGEILSSRSDRIQTLWFRAGVIIGSGSASFEIIRHLVQKLPLLITPKWVRTKTQPIGSNELQRDAPSGSSRDGPEKTADIHPGFNSLAIFLLADADDPCPLPCGQSLDSRIEIRDTRPERKCKKLFSSRSPPILRIIFRKSFRGNCQETDHQSVV
jgi:uncharacterized protein YbjT (DUF2867 family)